VAVAYLMVTLDNCFECISQLYLVGFDQALLTKCLVLIELRLKLVKHAYGCYFFPISIFVKAF